MLGNTRALGPGYFSSFDRFVELLRIRRHLAIEVLRNLAVGGDEVLVEVPLRLLGLPRELLEHRVGLRFLHVLQPSIVNFTP